MDDLWALPHIIDGRCNLCGLCIEACSNEVLTLGVKQPFLANTEECDCCGTCEEVCPENAIDCEFEIILEEDKPTEKQSKGEQDA